ncbi:MAG: TonB-dependent receptor, partial [Arenibacter sp.]|nr:TonB-dependent receptor [Arenibacter sp.]
LGYVGNGRKEFEEHHHHEGEEHGHEEEEHGHEEEEHTEAVLNMDLKTFSYNVQYQLPRWKKFETILGVQGIYQTNTNYGEEVLIPDATTQDFGVLGTTHYHVNRNNDFQFGIRFDRRRIESSPYGQIGEEGHIAAINRSFNSFNGAFGYKNNISESLTGRFNIATGFRAPNLAELTSYGGHAGANRFEIGNADLKNEQNIQLDLALEFKNEHVELFVNGFHNSVNNYIFIAPDGTFLNGRSVYRYVQQDATLYGGEIGFHFHPHPYDWLHVESSYQTVIGELDEGAKLPLIPANTLTNTLRVEFANKDSWLKKSNAFITLNNTFKQNRVADNETVSPGYSLLSAGFGGEFSIMKQAIEVNFSANNILDKQYIAHLSRLKPDGIYNMGRSITLGASILF